MNGKAGPKKLVYQGDPPAATGIATFCNLFHVIPPGRYQVRVCRGTGRRVDEDGRRYRR